MKLLLRAGAAAGIALALAAAATPAVAQNVTPSFGATVPGYWFTDRYEPTTFGLTNGTHGRNDVLNIGITSAGDYANRPSGYQYTFYNTQGRQYTITSGPGSYLLSADLWVKGTWASNPPSSANSVRTDMWGVATNAAGNPWDYPIIGFSNWSGTGVFRGYDVNTGAWINFNNTVNYNAWNTLALGWDANTDVYTYYVNGATAGTVQGDGVATGLGAVIMQAYNFNDPKLVKPIAQQGNPGSSDYTAEWSNTPAVTATPEPASLALMATGLVAMAGVVRRRRQAR